MSANIDTMLYVGETPWHGLGKDMTANPPKTSAEIIEGAQLGWTTNYARMKTDIHGEVPSWNAIYREDNNEILGVVHKARPILVQNTDTFNAVESMLGDKLDVETAASLGRGETVFGCFKIREQYRLLDDDLDHYFVIVNDHLKSDGKVTVLNTPVRVVCQNTLSEALNSSLYKLRVPITADTTINSTLAQNLITSVGSAISSLKATAEKMVAKKIDKAYITKMLDLLFPFQLADGTPIPSKANDAVAAIRQIFLDKCMGADNIANYRGTQYQCFMALTDFTQHYHKSAEKAYDINHRMKSVPGINVNVDMSKVMQYLRIADKISV